MSNEKTMSEVEIASKIRAKKPFKVYSNRDRKAVLTGAKFLGVRVVTAINTTATPPFFNVMFP